MNDYTTECSILVLTERALWVRAGLEPMAWVVLEQLAMSATDVDGQVVSEQSVRTLAASLGRSKDAVARAVRQLAASGLVERTENRHGFSGRFTGAHYLIDLQAAGLRLPATLNSPSRPTGSEPVTPPPPKAHQPESAPSSATSSLPQPASRSSQPSAGRLW
jgi:DNA-binding transcriptional MocR family regulator